MFTKKLYPLLLVCAVLFSACASNVPQVGREQEKEKTMQEINFGKMLLRYEESQNGVPTLLLYVFYNGHEFIVDHFYNTGNGDVGRFLNTYGRRDLEQYLDFYIPWPVPDVADVGQPNIRDIYVGRGKQEVIPIGEHYGLVNFFHKGDDRTYFLIVSCVNKFQAEKALANLIAAIRK